MKALVHALRRRDRQILRSMEERISAPRSASRLVRHFDRLYISVRHDLLYGAIRHLNLSIPSAWKVLLAVVLHRGDVFVDAGANVGRISHAAAMLVGRHGEVHSFEPSPAICAELRRRLRYFGVGNTVVNELALGAGKGSGILHEYEDGRGGSSSLEPGSHAGHRHDRETRVRIGTLDGYVRDHGIRRIRMIKIDVEGAELDVLTGGSSTISAQRPVLVVEASRSTSAAFGRDLDELIAAIHGFGYGAFSWRSRRLVAVESSRDIPGDWHHDDLVCLVPSFHDETREKLVRLSRRPA